MKDTIIAITGATASGKSNLAIELAKKIGAQIISCDSRQIYKEFDIATAKPSIEEMQGIKHHLFDIITPDKTFSASDYAQIAKEKIEQIQKEGDKVIVAGGTGFYFRILLEGLTLTDVKPNETLRKELSQLAKEKGNNAVFEILKNLDTPTSEKIHPNNLDKIIRAIEISKALDAPMSSTGVKFNSQYNVLWVGIEYKDRQKLYDKINLRVNKMIERGLEEEAKNLLAKYGEISSLTNTIGYQEFIPYFKGECTREEAIEKIKQNTRKYAKRQLTWFRANKKLHRFYMDETDINSVINSILMLI